MGNPFRLYIFHALPRLFQGELTNIMNGFYVRGYATYLNLGCKYSGINV